jgi:hypothetical protein
MHVQYRQNGRFRPAWAWDRTRPAHWCIVKRTKTFAAGTRRGIAVSVDEDQDFNNYQITCTLVEYQELSLRLRTSGVSSRSHLLADVLRDIALAAEEEPPLTRTAQLPALGNGRVNVIDANLPGRLRGTSPVFAVKQAGFIAIVCS